MKSRHFFHFFVLLLSLIFIPASLLAAGIAGEWKEDVSVQKTFQEGRMLPHHTYYYLGSYEAPETVIAIDNDYKLESKRVWAKAERVSDQTIKEWMQSFTIKQGNYHYTGGTILTPDGKKAGIWYSPFNKNIVRMPRSGVLEVYQPQPLIGSPSKQD